RDGHVTGVQTCALPIWRRPREILQVGGELLGVGGVVADVEVLRLALALVGSAGVAEFQLNLGHVGALAPALAALSLDERAAVRRSEERRVGKDGRWRVW